MLSDKRVSSMVAMLKFYFERIHPLVGLFVDKMITLNTRVEGLCNRLCCCAFPFVFYPDRPFAHIRNSFNTNVEI
jgi:hypothetical protein